MKETIIDIEQLSQDAHNFNRGTEEGRELMQRSLQQLGAGRSILIDKDNNIIAGNKTQEAARKAGIRRVRIIETSGDELVAVKRTDIDIDSVKGRELALVDNLATQINLQWDEAQLETVDVEGFDPGQWGWEPPEMGDNVNPDDYGEDFSLPEGDHADFRRYGFMLHESQYERAVIALKMAKSDAGFKAFCDSQPNLNENGNAISFIIQQWVEQKKSSLK